ncbi:MAG: SH3 domain-containing protein [Lachnospiraceae bacterium]|nr:SH3 domain-containing protein [Lachnospiraceae bacterium]
MKRGSNMLLAMMGAYVLIALVIAVIYFWPGSNPEEMPASLKEKQEAVVRGDASSDAPVPDNWSVGGAAWQDVTPTPEPTPAEEAEPVPEKQYYSFRVIDMRSYLYVRKEPDKASQKLGEMPSGTKGYVLEPGEDWSLITTEDGKIRGYCSNKYMEFTEISAEEMPEEYR